MLDFIKILQDRTEAKKEREKDNYLLLDSPVSDFIPYACHYDKDTILTKNGELLQSIKIEGFSYKELGDKKLNLRDMIKQVMKKMKSNNLAMYLHTIRKRQKLDTNPQYDNVFSRSLHSSWVKKNNWDKKFTNELHITIVHSGMPLKVGYYNFFKMFFLGSVLNEHEKLLEKSAAELNSVVNETLNSLSGYGAIKLGMKYDDTSGYHSEILKFFASIIHLEESNIDVPTADLSKYLAKYKIAFGNNALEVKKNAGKFFATILSLKKYEHASLDAIDIFLQLPIRFVITQTVNFISSKEALKSYKYQGYVLEVSRDKEFKEISGIGQIMEKNEQYDDTSFCASQVTIMIIEDELKNLDTAIKTIRDKIARIGIPVVREDINMENCFWSQLPGNFSFISRKNIMPSSNIGSFASLYNFPFGSLKGKWGEPITLISTISGTPYFFNFHVDDNGHTIIVGDYGSGKSALLNFLLSESLKVKPKVLYFDSYMNSEIYIKALGGKHKVLSFDNSTESIKFNPLLLEDSAENRDFLKYWFIFLLDKYADPSNIEEYFQVIEGAIKVIFSLPKEQRKLSNVSEFFVDTSFAAINKVIIDDLASWHGKGTLSHIFDNDVDELLESLEDNIFAIDMTAIYDTPIGINLPILNYLLHCFKTYYTGQNPSILAVASGNRVFNSIYFEKNLEYILKDLRQRNALFLTHASFSSEKVNWSGIIGQIYNREMATKIFLADDSAHENVIAIFELSDEEQMYLNALDKTDKQFMIKQQTSAVVASLDLSDTNESKVLTYNARLCEIAKETMAKYSNDPNKWLPEFYKQSL